MTRFSLSKMLKNRLDLAKSDLNICSKYGKIIFVINQIDKNRFHEYTDIKKINIAILFKKKKYLHQRLYIEHAGVKAF